jgi:hypothetical protein
MRVVLDLNASAGGHIEGTASWVGGPKPVAFSGWLALMRVLEDAQRHTGGAPTPPAIPDSADPGHGKDQQ